MRLGRRSDAQAFRAVGWLMLTQGALRLWSYSTVRRALDRISLRRVAAPMTPAECERALRRAARLLPGASCLARAIAAACMLRRDGSDSTLTIGVRFDPDRRLHAHAWLESGGLIVTGRQAQSDHRVLLRDAIDRPGLAGYAARNANCVRVSTPSRITGRGMGRSPMLER